MPQSQNIGLNRRQLLHAGALGSFGLTLPQLLRAESTARPGKIKSCIIVFAFGGPAQHETFDMKPNAPDNVRGEFKPIATKIPGIHICEHLPKLAGITDKYSIIRSATHKNRIHNPGSYYMLSGRKPDRDVVEFPAKRGDWPAVGSVLAKLRPGEHSVPPYVVLPVFANDVNIPTPGQHAGFLGAAHDPLVLSGDPNTRAFGVPALAPRPELTIERIEGRRNLLAQIDRQTHAISSSNMQSDLDAHYTRAFDLISSSAAKKAFDLEQESPTTRDRYGRNRHGQSVLLARRLVEAGVRLVLVNDAEANGQNKVWDTHGGGFNTMRKHLPETDSAMSSLLKDLEDRGMLDSTLVVWMGEFGRSPKVDKAGGRDHWPDVYSILMAGGGIRGGSVYGASDSHAAYPKDKPVSPEDIHSTIYRALGIPNDTLLHDNLGRPLALFAGNPILDLF